MPHFPRVGDLFGRYRIDSQIGQGGMGVVFGATDTDFDRQVALKVVSASLGGSAEFLARFEREASLLARLNSPHVIAIFDYGEQDGCPYIATQYVGGGDLGGLIAARGPMPPALAATVCAQVADALADAHRAGVVHRDVKPSNVLLRDADTLDLHAYLCDFGIARTEADGLTAPGAVSGTWSYLAPEVGAGAVGTPASDLYATGCLLWAALTGHAPYGGSDVEIAIAHQRSPVPQLAGDDPFTRHVNAILANTLAKDPRSRYRDADALRADLLAAAALPTAGVRPTSARSAAPTLAPTPIPTPGSAPPTAPPPGHHTRGARSSRRRTTALVALSALAVLAVTGGIAAVTLLGGDDDPSPTAGGGTTASADPTGGISAGSPTDPTGPTGPTGPTDPTGAPASTAEGPVRGDVDGDGFADLSILSLIAPERGASYYERTTWTSDGSALVDPVVDRPERPKDRSDTPVIGDFDGDDLLEVLEVYTTTDDGVDPRLVGELSGGGAVDQGIRRPGGGTYSTAFAGDVDGDGTEDLLLVAWGKPRGMTVSVSLSDGSRFGTPRRALDLVPGYSFAEVEVGDYDGDGLADVSVLTTPDVDYPQQHRSTAQTYLGTGEGTFREDGRPRRFVSEIGLEAVTGDVDGDQDDELVVGLNKSDFIQLTVLDYAEGMGKARAVGLLPLPTSNYFDSAIVMGDYDGDGKDDVLSVGPSAAKGKALVQVAQSSGDQFSNASRWAIWDFELEESYGPSLLGGSFP
ncbi:protein kinase domain-containing protein [Nocardioides sp.]|uniref:protein kinase domain-containing protein n=1 Tax=Nocardioides sp. TaxID=35761 RepID=UPI00286B75AD|nr:protein kinase [Nocardioides sp.]